MTDMVVGLNFRSTIAQQGDKCLECETPIDASKDRIYFRMKQSIHLYEAYCEKCGLIKTEEDKQNGLKVEE